MKNRIELNGHTLRSNIEEMAWKKAGFKNRIEVLNAVRNLPAEERLEMLTEMFLTDLAQMYMSRRIEFIEKLGGHPGVTKEEIIAWARENYRDTDTTEWYFDIACDYYVSSRLTVDWYNKEHRMEWLKEQRRNRA